jgi:membrane protein implicated in regulation of membrane protease activity
VPSRSTNSPVAVQGTGGGTQTVAGTSALSPFGWRSLDGRVIQVEPIYLANPDFHWARFFVKLAILGAAVYYYGILILAVFGVFLLLMWMLSKVPFLSAIAVQVVSFVLTRRLMGPMANVPVRDIRIRDSGGQEFLVRMKGQLNSGSVSVGDDVLVEGWDRNGMLLFRRGYNKRIRTAIKVKHE